MSNGADGVHAEILDRLGTVEEALGAVREKLEEHVHPEIEALVSAVHGPVTDEVLGTRDTDQGMYKQGIDNGKKLDQLVAAAVLADSDDDGDDDGDEEATGSMISVGADGRVKVNVSKRALIVLGAIIATLLGGGLINAGDFVTTLLNGGS